MVLAHLRGFLRSVSKVDGEDLVVRRAAAEAFGRYNGTVVALDATTGRILTMLNQQLALSGRIPALPHGKDRRRAGVAEWKGLSIALLLRCSCTDARTWT